MNRADLDEQLKTETELTKSAAQQVVEILFGEMTKELENGGRVEIRGLCSFYVKEYKAYTGRNPKAGEPTKIAPKKLPFFKAGKELKERADR